MAAKARVGRGLVCFPRGTGGWQVGGVLRPRRPSYHRDPIGERGLRGGTQAVLGSSSEAYAVLWQEA